MTRTYKRIIATGIVFILVAAVAVALVMAGGRLSSADSPIDKVRNGVVNAVLDVSGVKGRIDSELRERTGVIASELGVPQSLADDIVDSLAIEDWRAVTLPADAKDTGTSTVNVRDVPIAITTYEDPGIVTMGAYGLSMTLAVPESAQFYTSYLQYLKYLT